jgi:hypothetical protein
MLREFEQDELSLLEEPVEKRSVSDFNERFAKTAQGCNECHAALAHGFIRYRLPEKLGEGFLDFTPGKKPAPAQTQ